MSSSNIGAIAAAVIAMLGAAYAVWVQRNDRSAKLTREGMDVMLRDSRIFTAMRRDLWAMQGWAHDVCAIHDKTPDAPALPPLPESELEKLEQELAKRGK